MTVIPYDIAVFRCRNVQVLYANLYGLLTYY